LDIILSAAEPTAMCAATATHRAAACSCGWRTSQAKADARVRSESLHRRPLPGFGVGDCGQLQHGGTLAHTQSREQHDLSVRELKRVVMQHGIVNVDLPDPRKPMPDLLVWQNANTERRLAFDVLVEHNFGAAQQTDRNVRLPNGGKAAGDGSLELGRHQLVLDLSRPGRDVVQTVVTHSIALLSIDMRRSGDGDAQRDPG